MDLQLYERELIAVDGSKFRAVNGRKKVYSVITNAAELKNDEFEYNKDAGTMQCAACELAMSVEKLVNHHGNKFLTYYFSKKKCKKCPLADKGKVGLSKTKTYSITIISERNKERLALQ